ncbi:MAG: gamma-glutamyl-gamma-aminobutyrate hydrolase family protein [Gemmatales bacterium]|nr:gamma-glutamyl-gamma-aminobutyrate hydrolase family protein [Gemmatales bacterium]MCS7160467.1 gamma-glutamyl-gamma-aminobutyrate hydrolase family protein [Gemmatales bacterium]MDW8175667.1 gamma-glutamyl-gamma-aminobutyrate hydrolase family protein [Gemmatales bacterium]MDW8222996.1 gamma-glutamyl-gamma-aminobutyrate hydrolase family protein [Gemmatales bacterium]
MKRQVRPVIGVNTDLVLGKLEGSGQIRVHIGYAQSVYAAGGLPILIPPVLKKPELESLLERVDGLVLVGGQGDLDPKRQGLPRHHAVEPIPAQREEFDRLLCQLAIERELPILGVALGMHLLNVLCGGTLYMHLPEDLPRSLPHLDTTEAVHRHAVKLMPGSRLELIYGEEEILVNSYHHQAVKEVAPGFRVAAVAPDGVIEAIESESDDWWAMGVQWHPHSETASKLDLQIFEALVQACGKRESALSLAA